MSPKTMVFINFFGSIALIAIIVCVIMFAGGTNVEFEPDSFEVKGTFAGSEEVDIEDITSVSLIDTPANDERSKGFSNKKYRGGIYINDNHEVYAMYVRLDNDTAIRVVHEDGEILVFNLKSKEDTEKTYERILTMAGLA